MPRDDLAGPRLQLLAQRRTHPRAFVSRAEAPPAALLARARHEVRRQHRKRRGRGRQRLSLREVGAEGVDRAPGAQRVEQPVALGEQQLAIAAGMHERRRVGQDGERRGLRPREVLGVAAEVAPGGGIEADGVAAEGRVGGVEAEHLPFRKREREPQREHGLDRLLGERAGPSLAREPHHLHRQRAAAAHHAALADVAERRAAERDGIDAGVPVEAAVLEAGDRGRELLGDRARHAEAPLAVGRDRGARGARRRGRAPLSTAGRRRGRPGRRARTRRARRLRRRADVSNANASTGPPRRPRPTAPWRERRSSRRTSPPRRSSAGRSARGSSRSPRARPSSTRPP